VAGGGWWRCSAPLAYAWRRGIEYRLLPIPKLIPAEGAVVGGMDDGGGGDMFGRSGSDDDEIEREMGRWSLGKRREKRFNLHNQWNWIISSNLCFTLPEKNMSKCVASFVMRKGYFSPKAVLGS
jgi:hypothetical protein